MKRSTVADAVGVGAAKLAASVCVIAAGFRAVSDDDYARIVIAQRFAETPHLDPSGTSWLPVPFWIYGAAFRLLGGSLAVAQGVAVFLGVGAALLLLRAARLCGAGRAGALLGALLAALFPWSVYLGAAAVPEAPTAALLVYGMATLAVDAPRERALGAFAIAAGCFSRYEAWPVAAVFAVFTLLDARKARDARAALPAFVALGPIALWLLHGVFIHGDALFFWKRVAAYRHALGPGPLLGARLLAVPRWLFATEPELWLGLLVVLGDARSLSRMRRPLVACAALFAFLALGEVMGGGPTHHAERAVLAVWFVAALGLGGALGRAIERRPARRLAWCAYAAAVLVFGWLYRAAERPDFVDRGPEIEAGARARELGAPALLIDTLDYGYLAVTASFGKPNAAVPFDDRDPRHASSPDALASVDALRSAWSRDPSAWLALRTPFNALHVAVARRSGTVRAESPRFVLIAPGPATDPNDESAGTPSAYPRLRPYK